MPVKSSTVYVVASGSISGTYADRFHVISDKGKIGYYLDRDPSPDERKIILKDIERHRAKLNHELENLSIAQFLLEKVK